MTKMPAMMFYVGDWRKDPNLCRCTHAAKGVWVDILCLMHESEERGVLPWAAEEIANAVGGERTSTLALIDELTRKGVCTIREDGAMVCRRMVRDESKRRICTEAGKKGGNPKLREWNSLPGFVYAIRRLTDGRVKIGASVKPSERKDKGMGSFKGGECELVAQWPVGEMGKAESFLHGHFDHKCLVGEWFDISEEEIYSITSLLLDNNLSIGTVNPKIDTTVNPPLNMNMNMKLNMDMGIRREGMQGERYDSIVLPPQLETATFREAWQNWQQHRREIKKPLKPTQIAQQLRDFSAVGVERAITQMNTSVRNGWQGLFEEKENGNRSTGTRGNIKTPDEHRAAKRAREYHDPATDVA